MALSDQQRFPLLDDRGAQTLKSLLEHPHAPKWNYACGDMLSRDDLTRVREFENQLQTPTFWKRDDIPDWLQEFRFFCENQVPFYRARKPNVTSSTRTNRFLSLPTINRQDLASEPWSFVPDAQSLDEMVMYWTSGTTSEPLPILSHPRTTSMYLPLLQKALSLGGVDFSFENYNENRVAIALICAQKKTLTYASVSSVLDNAGFVKINLHDDDWKHGDDVLQFLESCNPAILTGDPLSFYALMQLTPMQLESSTRMLKPRALVSSATTLSPALKAQLEAHFACPVLDVYSSNEAGMIASSTRNDNASFEILPHDIYVETLREDGSTCDENEIGEIVVSGGRNPFLPLLRYRTGDFARLTFDEGRRFLRDFSGRAPVLFRDARGQIVSSIDVASALRPFALAVFAFHQNANGDLELRLPNAHADENALRAVLQKLFGERDVQIVFGKIVKTTYSSDL